MLTIEGQYKNGQIFLTQIPENLEESKVLVSFLATREINLGEVGVGERQAFELRSKLNAISEDWNAPEMDVYDVD